MTVEAAESFRYTSEVFSLFQTLLGAGIAFGAAYVSAKYTKDRESLVALSARERERIERIYYLLVLVRKDLLEDSKQCLTHINCQTGHQVKSAPDFPPLLEIEMLVGLYFPALDENLNKLNSSVIDFSTNKIDFFLKNYESAPKSLRQEDSSKIVGLTMMFNAAYKEFQTKLKDLSKV
ncbi:hypothetical protein AB4307_03220 [Vibrio sp. 10N.261.52.C2]|uniref:hypothetical protein n=1 Tax=Vibrio sp. 10N.261.52.C2 TaxID=3229681 RepID=UPI00354B28D8